MASNNFQLVQNLTKAIEKALNESLERKDTEQSTSPTKPPSPPLPSAVLPRWRPPAKKSKKQASKTPKPKKQYTKNVVCIYQKDSGAISIPRGEQRALLTEAGLVAKLNIDHSMSALEIRQEIDNLFAECFGLEHLTYSYLSIMPGSKKLHVPKTSKAFTWDAPQVLSVCTRDTLYILVTSKPIKDPLDRKLKQESFDSSDSDEMLLHSPFSDYNPGKAKSDHLSVAAVPPPLGFDTTPTIQFSLTNALPSANTCATLLTLPCMYKEYETFKHKMDFAILNSPCFGQV